MAGAGRTAVLAVPEPARAFAIAGLAHSRASAIRSWWPCRPTADAERLAHDLRAFLGPDEVDVFPAWETLPFERVSPSVETMGRRLRAMWRLRDPDAHAARARRAGAGAACSGSGPHVEDVEPVVVAPGRPARPDRPRRAGSSTPATAASTRSSTAARSRCAGSIVDVFPSTADAPVRIDLWGDEVDRLTEFAVADQRSTDDVDRVEIFPCRELLPTDEVRERAAQLVGARAVGPRAVGAPAPRA